MNSLLLAVLALYLIGFCLAVGGTFVLAGAGWALLVGALGPFLAAGILLRGMKRG